MKENRLTDGPLVVAIDSSTTSTKAIVVDAAGNVWHTAKRDIQLHTPAMDHYEHTPERWWDTTHDVIGEVLAKLSTKDRERVGAIGITHQRETFAPFTSAGGSLRQGILWLDSRASSQIKKYGSAHVHEISGKPAGVTPAIYKMAWVKENEPEVFDRADKVTDVHGYLSFCLTGRWASSTASADSLGLLDIREFDYSDELLEIAGLTRSQLPELVPPAETIGMLLPSLVDEWNLSKPIPIIAGLGDGQAAGIGAAAVDPQVSYLNLGTAVVAGVESPTYAYDPVFRTMVGGIPGDYVFEIVQSSGSYLAGWFREALGDPKLLGAPDPALDAAAALVPPGAEGLITLPYWNAVQSPHWDALARGAVVGWRGTHSRAHMYRSILESIGYEMRLNLDSVEQGTGVKIELLRGMGGGTRSDLWSQIMADTIGVPLSLCLEDEISALGAAAVAMAGINAHGSHDVANSARQMAHFGKIVEPNMKMHEQYLDVASTQRKIYPQLKGIFEELHSLAERYPSTRPESPKAEL